MYNTKEKYQNDPEFKKKHLAYVKEKITCECGRQVTRANYAPHKKTKIHKNSLVGENCKLKSIEVLIDLKRKCKDFGSEKTISEAIDAIDDEIEKISRE